MSFETTDTPIDPKMILVDENNRFVGTWRAKRLQKVHRNDPNSYARNKLIRIESTVQEWTVGLAEPRQQFPIHLRQC